MILDLHRTFSSPPNGHLEEQGDYDNWFRYFNNGKDEKTWTDLLKHHVVVILGEAGIGKTVEFENEVGRLHENGHAAFFIPLNQIVDRDSFSLALGGGTHYEHWKSSNAHGFFFLDAIDESRLTNHAKFERALMLIRNELRPFLARVTFVLSSRMTDWGAPGVKESVESHLLEPINRSRQSNPVMGSGDAAVQTDEGSGGSEAQQVAVFYLDPLSIYEAKRFAAACGVTDADAFWDTVADGGYEFMATRPLDLEWMAQLWSEQQRLGGYLELIESAIANRLEETNPSYVQSNTFLSPGRLREGVEQLAAACVLSGRAYISTSSSATAGNEIAAASALPDWADVQRQRLLGTAIFDEATYGRVKFHHRAIREYLAACWLSRRIQAGMPLHHVMQLFINAPYGHPVLVNSRRATLCWLAAIDAGVRENVIRQHPEMLMFDGDPERWSVDDVVEAFDGFIAKLTSGYRPDWHNDASELRRVARKLPQGVLADRLAQHSGASEVSSFLLRLIRHGQLVDCADAVFQLYQTAASDSRTQHAALFTLSWIASEDQRQQVLNDLVSGRIDTNEMRAAALSVISVDRISETDLGTIFKSADAEADYGAGPMASIIKHNLIPGAPSPVAQKLLTALLAALPQISGRQHINRYREAGQLREAWMLEVLPDCLLRVLELLPEGQVDAPDYCFEAALILEKIRDSGFVDVDEGRALRDAIMKLPQFRKRLALAIGTAADIPHGDLHLTSASEGLVSLTKDDLDWLISEANVPDLASDARKLCYKLSIDIAFFALPRQDRRRVLAELASGSDQASRLADIQAFRMQRANALKRRRQVDRDQHSHRIARQHQQEQNRLSLLADIDGIRDGSKLGAIRFLQEYAIHAGSSGSGTRSRYTHLDIEAIERDFGRDISTALSQGLQAAWRQISVSAPSNHRDNSVPIVALIGLAGLNESFSNGLSVSSLSPGEVEQAAKLSVWGLEPEPWFDDLARAHPDIVARVLQPWFETEVANVPLEGQFLRTFDLVSRTSAPVRQILLQTTITRIEEGQIASEQVGKQLLRALRENNLVDDAWVAQIAIRRLAGPVDNANIGEKSEWLAMWASWDPVSAWEWFESQFDLMGPDRETFLTVFADKIDMKKWLDPLTNRAGTVETLVRMYRFLTGHLPVANGATANRTNPADHPIERVRDRIPQIIARTTGPEANRALADLLTAYQTEAYGWWLEERLMEHSRMEAERRVSVDPADLPNLGSVYCREPDTERELFEQVLARLEEIKLGVEEGPFSDRVLFEPGMREKKLQIWLAARLRDTPLRHFIPRYQVEREGEVDANNRTDIQVSSAVGKICIEIKPVGGASSYSATRLVSTLQDQIVGQYLRGYNSAHGILVIFRLDERQWELPGRTGRVGFNELLTYLEQEARRIKAENWHVGELRVFGIDCVEPG